MSHKINIVSDDVEIERLLKTLAQLVLDSGGLLHPDLEIHVEQGQIMVMSDVSDSELLVRLPELCLLPVDEKSFALEGDDIVINSYPQNQQGSRKELLDTMVAIYNYGDKIYHHRRVMPWLAFCEIPELLHSLYQARVDGVKPSRFYALAKGQKFEQLALDSFIGSRQLGYLSSQQQQQKVLMPFIDFFNHHLAAPPFGLENYDLSVVSSHPLTDSRESFVSYGKFDAMDSFLVYGFADASSLFVRSVPVSVRLKKIGTIKILGAPASQPTRKTLPPAMKSLGFFMPEIVRPSEDEFLLTYLFVPGTKAPMAMHRVLGFVIQQLVPDIEQVSLQAAVELAVEEVLVANEDYYASLKKQLLALQNKLAATPALEQLETVIELQQQKLSSYRQSLG